MFTGMDKMFAAFLTPLLVKGLALAAGAVGIDAATLDLSGTATVILSLALGAVVYLIPNKLKA